MARPRGALFFWLLAVVIGNFCLAESEVKECIKGPYHKDKPSPEGPEYVECQPWKENSCCTAEFTAELKRNQVEILYNFSWHHCKNLTQACERYIKNEECFWSCEPNLIKWHVKKGAVNGVPICAKYCDDWFEACKNDYTCAEDWLEDFNYTSSVYSCPKTSKCRTFSEVYTDGKGLCNKMWGKSFTYEKSDNCMVMWFDGKNPNGDVTPPNRPRSTPTCCSMFLCPASIACERYIKNEECFWSCEPNLIKWHVKEGAVDGVPICAKYCDDWFEACKNDYTCAENWLEDFNYTTSVSSCLKTSKCRTFSEVYTDGKGLCNKMWGKSFTYEKSDNCMVMWFDGKNPNGDVTPPNPRSTATCCSMFLCPASIVSLIILLLGSY